ncbi:MAG: hypothetical protein SFU85_02390 [Candidatus Methylacidiphilales bacterium]|nr:hypothetical protein [Candidatus Methylacidiphilales bacterium]
MCLNRWNCAFQSPKVIRTIRAKIRRNLDMGQSVLVDLENVRGMERSSFDEIVADWPWEKVRILAPGMQAWLPVAHEVPEPKEMEGLRED